MFAALLSLVAATAGALSYDLAEHPPSWYDEKVRTVETPLPNGDAGCIERLRAARIQFRLLANVEGVTTPVEVTDKSLGLVTYKPVAGARRFILDCHTVEVLAYLGRRLRAAGVATVYWSSAWRYSYLKGTKTLSEHAHGRALDIVAIDGSFGYATVKGHYQRGLGDCGDGAKTKKAKHLRRLICAATRDKAFATVYTPDTDAIHADHLHLQDPLPSIRHVPHRRRRSRTWMLLALGGVALAAVGGGLFWWRQRAADRDPG